jgi:hypothetical protein
MNHDSLNLRCGNVKFFWSPTNQKYELQKWTKDKKSEYAIVVAFYDETPYGWNMNTVGRRLAQCYEDHPDATKIVSNYAFDILEARKNAVAAATESNLSFS